jgi:hypothetical protein
MAVEMQILLAYDSYGDKNFRLYAVSSGEVNTNARG